MSLWQFYPLVSHILWRNSNMDKHENIINLISGKAAKAKSFVANNNHGGISKSLAKRVDRAITIQEESEAVAYELFGLNYEVMFIDNLDTLKATICRLEAGNNVVDEIVLGKYVCMYRIDSMTRGTYYVVYATKSERF